MPFVRMQVVMKIAVRSGTNPFLPMQSSGHRQCGRPRAYPAIGTVGPAMCLGHFADDTRPNELAQSPVTLLAMALVAHLRRRLGLTGHLPQFPRLPNIV